MSQFKKKSRRCQQQVVLIIWIIHAVFVLKYS